MKKIFIFTLFIFIIVFLLTQIIFIDKDIPKKNIYQDIPFYKEAYLDRYNSYKEKNPNIETLDIVTRVNLNLDKKDYTDVVESNHLNKTDILVNKHIYLRENYIPDNLVKINPKYTISDKYLVSDANIWLEKMINDIIKNNLNIRIISAYRSYSYQKDLYDKYVKEDGIIKADTYSARPGYSEHQTGLVIDVDNGTTNYEQFEKTKEFKWMQDNSHKYGYILRYPKDKEKITGYNFESWHYRYVGVEIATYIHKNNITFDEYYIRFIEK